MKERTVQKRFDDDYKLNELLVNDFMIKLTDFFFRACAVEWPAKVLLKSRLTKQQTIYKHRKY